MSAAIAIVWPFVALSVMWLLGYLLVEEDKLGGGQ